MTLGVLTGFYFLFFLLTNILFFKICTKIMDKAKFGEVAIYIVSIINSSIFSVIIFGFNQAPTMTYLMVLLGSIIELKILFKNGILGILVCSFTATIYLVCTESLVISSGVLIMGITLGELFHDHLTLVLLIVISWFICMLIGACVHKFVDGRFLRIINQNKEQTLFVLGFLFMSTVYLTLNSFIYANADSFDQVYLPIHQIVTPMAWMGVVTLSIALLIRFDYLHGYKVKSEILEHTIEKEKTFNEYILKKVDTVFEIDCYQDKLIRYVRSGQEMSTDGLPPFSDFLCGLLKSRTLESDHEAIKRISHPENMISAFKRGEFSSSIHVQALDSRGIYRWMELSVSVEQRSSDREIIGLHIVRDIDAEKTELIENRQKAERDSLVGAFNKVTTQVKIAEELMHGQTGAFFILDVDDFKNINDSKGHPFGDKVLIYLYKRIVNTFREHDIIGRIGGDEFVIFLKNPRDIELVKNKANALFKDFEVPFVDEYGDSMMVCISVGIAIAPEHGTDFDTLYKKADSALYESKKKGKNTYTIYSE